MQTNSAIHGGETLSQGMSALAMKLKTVLLDEVVDFLSEGSLFVMFLLVVDVQTHVVEHRFAYRDGKVLVCPLERCSNNLLFVDPVRAFPLEQL